MGLLLLGHTVTPRSDRRFSIGGTEIKFQGVLDGYSPVGSLDPLDCLRAPAGNVDIPLPHGNGSVPGP